MPEQKTHSPLNNIKDILEDKEISISTAVKIIKRLEVRELVDALTEVLTNPKISAVLQSEDHSLKVKISQLIKNAKS